MQCLEAEGLVGEGDGPEGEHPQQGGDWEYSVVMTIRNERGEEVSRQVVGVGALRQGESRTFTLSVEVLAPGGGRPK